MDVVYPYKRTADDFELRYSLRSLVNLPHGRVIVAGDKPRIASDVLEWVGVVPQSDRFKSSTANLLAAAEEGGLSDRFVVMHDDIFVLTTWSFRHENRGTIDEYLARAEASGGYRRRAERTRDILRAHGIAEPLFFGLHTPTVYDRRLLIDLAREFAGKGCLFRTIYHNLHPAPSERHDDVKVRRWGERVPDDILSVSDAVGATPAFREWIGRRFPQPSPYERSERIAA